jgi:hypothetical protein
MKNFLYGLLATVIVAVPALTQAASGFADGAGGADGGNMAAFFRNITTFMNNVLVPLVLGIAFLAFVWGVFKFFILGGSDSEKQAEGKSLMIYAVAGFVLILSLYGIVNFIAQGFGFDNETIKIPNAPVERGI